MLAWEALCRPERALCWSEESSFGLRGLFFGLTSLCWPEMSLCCPERVFFWSERALLGPRDSIGLRAQEASCYSEEVAVGLS